VSKPLKETGAMSSGDLHSEGKRLSIVAENAADGNARLAQAIACPNISAARVVRGFGLSSAPKLDTSALIAELDRQATQVQAGDLKRVEAMLIGQEHALNAMFTQLAERAQAQSGMAQIQCLLGLALRSQSQCRATLETLAELKRPRSVAFVQQANIAHGPQQVNNPGGNPSDGRGRLASGPALMASVEAVKMINPRARARASLG
jgi:hypothetical protein